MTENGKVPKPHFSQTWILEKLFVQTIGGAAYLVNICGLARPPCFARMPRKFGERAGKAKRAGRPLAINVTEADRLMAR